MAFDIYYGASYDDVDNNHIYIETGVTNHTYDLSEFMPNFFKITRYDKGASLLLVAVFTELIINYSCSQTKCLVNATSSNSTFGTVSGVGTKTVGEEVTLTVTPASDYEKKNYGVFQGWYDGETLLSSNASYTFTPTSGTFSYHYEAKFVEAYSEKFTMATQLYYMPGVYYEPMEYISFLKCSNGTYYALASYQDATGDIQQFNAEGCVFHSVGHGTSSKTYDIWFNRDDSVYNNTYYTDSTGSEVATVKKFGYDIAGIDFYLDGLYRRQQFNYLKRRISEIRFIW